MISWVKCFCVAISCWISGRFIVVTYTFDDHDVFFTWAVLTRADTVHTQYEGGECTKVGGVGRRAEEVATAEICL